VVESIEADLMCSVVSQKVAPSMCRLAKRAGHSGEVRLNPGCRSTRSVNVSLTLQFVGDRRWLARNRRNHDPEKCALSRRIGGALA